MAESPRKFTSIVAGLFCFRSTGEHLPTCPPSPPCGNQSLEILPSSPPVLPPESPTNANLPSNPPPLPSGTRTFTKPRWRPCKNHTGTVTGHCTCGLDTLQDGSLDFHKIAEAFRKVLCNEELFHEDAYANEIAEASDSTHKEEDPRPLSIGIGRLFSYDELNEATHFFDSSRKLGGGAFGSVYLGTLKDGQSVAVKVLYRDGGKELRDFVSEVAHISSIHHQNLVTFLGATPGIPPLLVYEYMSNGSVADHLHSRRVDSEALTWSIRIRIAIETAEALAHLHSLSPPSKHCDVKTENILLDKAFHAKVCDFGLSSDGKTSTPGTQGYLDPEHEKGGILTEKSDVYSFGVVLLELISGEQAVDVERAEEDWMDDIYLVNMAPRKIRNKELEQLVDRNLEYKSDKDIRRMINSVAELACWCVQPKGNLRPTMSEVISSLKKIRDGTLEVTDQRVEHHVVSHAAPQNRNLSTGENRLRNITGLVPLRRINMQAAGVLECVEQVRRSFRHKLSSIAFFLVFKNTNHSGTECGCRLYLENNLILEGLKHSTCFLRMSSKFIVSLVAIKDKPPQIAQRTIEYMIKLRQDEILCTRLS